MDPIGSLARRFPLVARWRPACTPLAQRVADLAENARRAEHDRDLAGASAVYNLSALLASDVGLPELARTWCHRHARAYLGSHPLGAQDARLALEPLGNLARLHIRDGNGEQAYQLLESLHTAVNTRTAADIDGVLLPADLTDSADAHQELRRWTWALLLATGARALAVSGRWEQARARLAGHRGIGRRMLDGRQVAVIASLVAHDTALALDLLRDTLPGETTENAVTACLTLIAQDQAPGPNTLLAPLRELEPTPRTAVFRTRLTLSFIDTLDPDGPAARSLATDLITRTLDQPDGYTARDLLDHPGCTALLTSRQHRDLTTRVDTCGLGSQSLPEHLRHELDAALDRADRVIQARPAD
ncbi:hypothetical protein [Kitasatospora sp. NPDC098663]|uniref:hypothetical protein n=1 Tax=Kitasatospora sp. NPDC098663 TaxID=3364096 RepID=UPI003823AA00